MAEMQSFEEWQLAEWARLDRAQAAEAEEEDE